MSKSFKKYTFGKRIVEIAGYIFEYKLIILIPHNSKIKRGSRDMQWSICKTRRDGITMYNRWHMETGFVIYEN